MLSIQDGEALARALRSDIDHRIKALLRLRCEQLGGVIKDDVSFAIVEPGDTPADIEREIGFSILDADAPGLEWLQDQGSAFELVYVLTDAFTQVVIVPKDEAIDPELRAFCTQFAAEHA